MRLRRLRALELRDQTLTDGALVAVAGTQRHLTELHVASQQVSHSAQQQLLVLGL